MGILSTVLSRCQKAFFFFFANTKKSKEKIVKEVLTSSDQIVRSLKDVFLY